MKANRRITRSVEDLLLNYDEVSELCHSVEEPIFITKDGEVDLVIMGVEAFAKRFVPLYDCGRNET